ASASASVAATVFEGVFQGALGDGSAVADLTNSGAITVLADAVATFAGSANAFAQVFDGIDQNAVSYTVAGGNPDLASVTLTNSGTIDVRAQALASGGIGASA